MQSERSFRGISENLAFTYLEAIGAQVDQDENRAEGEGWSAELSSEKVSIGPTLELTEVTVVFEGEKDVLCEVIPKFAQKAVRAGG